MGYQGVDFEDEKLVPRRLQKEVSGLPGLVIKYGWAKNERQANIVLLGIAIVAVIATVIVLTTTGGDPISREVIDPDAGLNSEVQ